MLNKYSYLQKHEKIWRKKHEHDAAYTTYHKTYNKQKNYKYKQSKYYKKRVIVLFYDMISCSISADLYCILINTVQ